MAQWTDEQKQAIISRDKNILVAAAAGSGKTAVLVERIVERVLSGVTDIDELLVVTFTRAAAEEMRMRIRQALMEAAEENPADERIHRQLVLLSNASISTIHSFCQNVIRRNFSLLDISPDFKVANDQEMVIMKEEAMEEVFEEAYGRGEGEFLSFVREYGSDQGDNDMHQIIFRMFDFSQSQLFPDAWLEGCLKRFEISSEAELEKSDWLAELKPDIRNTLFKARAINDYIQQIAPELGGDGCREIYEQDCEVIDELLRRLENNDWKGFSQKINTDLFPKMPKNSWTGTVEDKKYVNETLRGQEKKLIVTGIQKKYFSQSFAAAVADLQKVKPFMQVICRLTQAFSQAFAAKKKERGVLDFNDMEHFAFRILRSGDSDNGEIRPSAAALELQGRYNEVMVDEYQDTNPLQDAILSLVMRQETPGSFVVGDIKQSIYRFRMAEPGIFQEKYESYPKRGGAYERILLRRNFRSRPEVLAGINYLFRQIMQKEAAELEYDDAAALYPGAVFADTEGKRLSGEIELDLIDTGDTVSGNQETVEDEDKDDLKGFELEAQHIANRIKRLVTGENGKDSGILVYDEKAPGCYRQIRWRDIVILLRNLKGRSGQLLEQLRNNDIPAYVSDDTGYFETMEIKVMLSLLAIIDNSRQDIPLAAVLRSPAGGFSAAELAEIRINSPRSDLFEALLAVNGNASRVKVKLREKTERFLKKLTGWRDLSRTVSVPRLIWELYRDTGYYEYVGSMPGGVQRQANLRALMERAEEYEKTDFRGLFRFLRFIEKMKARKSDLAIAATLGENEDVVRIMTIHSSKGLEFPVVILADIDKEFNKKDKKNTLLIGRRLGLGPYVTVGPEGRYSTLARAAVAAEIEQAGRAEEMRILYVALTRAKEKIILVGKMNRLPGKKGEWSQITGSQEPRLPVHLIAGVSSYLDWIAMAVIRHEDGGTLREIIGLDDPVPAFSDDSHWLINRIAAGEINTYKPEKNDNEQLLSLIRSGKPLPSTGAKAEVEHIMNWKYDLHGTENLPSKLSVSELKKRFSTGEEKVISAFGMEKFFRRPDFVKEKTLLTAAEYGTLMHSVLQHIDYRQPMDDDELGRQLDLMVQQEILLPEQRQLVAVQNIRQFYTSPLGVRLCKAGQVWRELPFSQMLQANKRFFPAVTDDEAKIFIQGVIDLLFEEDDGLVLVDYKTDRNTDPLVVRKKYKLQLELYAEAVTALTGKRVKERWLYLLQDGSIVAAE